MLLLQGTLLEKLRKIEALHAERTVDGEREAARRAAERIRARLAELRGRERDVELLYRLPDPWKRKLFWLCVVVTGSSRTARMPAATAQCSSAPPRRLMSEPCGRSFSSY
jgi:hypothetical protein